MHHMATEQHTHVNIKNVCGLMNSVNTRSSKQTYKHCSLNLEKTTRQRVCQILLEFCHTSRWIKTHRYTLIHKPGRTLETEVDQSTCTGWVLGHICQWLCCGAVQMPLSDSELKNEQTMSQLAFHWQMRFIKRLKGRQRDSAVDSMARHADYAGQWDEACVHKQLSFN